MYILGLNIGHNSTACLLNDGVVVGCISEERFTRVKNQTGIPINSIEYLLKLVNINIKKIDFVVLDNHYPVIKKDIVKRFIESYKKKSFSKKITSFIGYNYSGFFSFYSKFKDKFYNLTLGKKIENIKLQISSKLKYPRNKILVIDHHLCHALAPCLNLPLNEKTLIFTLDGEGGRTCASINLYEDGKIKVLSRSHKSASLGYLYALATMHLGMKPLEHEFKLMGLAPYAKNHKVDEIYSKFKKLIWIDDRLKFQSAFDMTFADIFFTSEMRLVRFDVVAGAVQRLVEDLTTEWVTKAIKRYKVNSIALSGGVFMNVKANQKIAKLQEVKKIFIMPSSGDESNSIGSALHGHIFFCKKNKISPTFSPLKDLYLGPEYNDEYVLKMIKKMNLENSYKIKKIKNINLEIAKLLAKGEIVARCTGRSEFGARALGNRSILANADNIETIKILNETIKDRDFWMPFTPSIIEEDSNRYLINDKKISAPYMTITFDSTKVAKKELPAAMHPYDSTIRPQIVTKSWNPDYYKIISEFKRITGRGAILNTSFNLHGEPNVLTPEDAIHTLKNSSLKYLALGKYLFEKKAN